VTKIKAAEANLVITAARFDAGLADLAVLQQKPQMLRA